MGIVTVPVVEGIRIVLGRQGENFAEQVVFDVTEWQSIYGTDNAECVLFVKRPKELEEDIYTAVTIQEGNKIIWPITSYETELVGTGACELQYWVNHQLVKSQTYKTVVNKSLTGNLLNGTVKDWADQLAASDLELLEAMEDYKVVIPFYNNTGTIYYTDKQGNFYVM